MKDAVDSGCRIHCGLWGVKSREGAAKSVVRIHPLALKHAGPPEADWNTGRLKTETNIRIRHRIACPDGNRDPEPVEGSSFEFRISDLVFRYERQL